MDDIQQKKLSRRDFLKLSKNTLIGAGIISLTPNWIWVEEGVAAVPASEGYLLVDTKKCQGCISCMLACSLVHEGAANPSLSRIQIMQNAFSPFPDDVMIAQCRQCIDPPCVDACPAGAIVFSSEIPIQDDTGYYVNLRDGAWQSLGYPID